MSTEQNDETYSNTIYTAWGQALRQAAIRGLLGIVDLIVGLVGLADADGTGAMIAAAKHNKVEAVLRLQQRGVPLEARDGAVVIAAAASGSLSVLAQIAEFITCGLAVRNGTALIVAARNGNVAIVRFLVQQGLKASMRDGEALIEAASNGHIPVMEYLWPRVRSKRFREAAMSAAVHQAQEQMVSWLESKSKHVPRPM
ncbi:hypothetical protein HXX76_016229 [Chlamydomonas incerta]|uniref:Uncharacterized protein n=1 Tax=Chlamydomonas incerta TaxID=51695 RepID=A0A835SAN0_CHLIN|nr:hypothetical protein HXX76_016321 [Chlamydomonas incerta]KAG2422101.1 hypothetical protein HXX76_016277 [Chlamydomonas incerta]KAG2422179.1 hypothetical protein HXX76_016229 [Chlamydomonas incerta]|eukprot:KAG2422034.1 hypothetical protein HXX76_016321 [Chlamydomonas incerta]